MASLRTVLGVKKRGRPTREETTLSDAQYKNKKKKKKKCEDSIEGDLTIFAQGDARKKKKNKKWDY